MNGMNQEAARIAYQAGDLFHQHGITATGVEASRRSAGRPGSRSARSTSASGSKDGLIAAAFEFATCLCSRSTPARSSERAGTPREQLKQLFVELKATIRAPESRGCPFTSASSELADLAIPHTR
jgi:hypothetical protein